MKISEVDAVIFDNDGVLVNSEKLSCEALARVIETEFNVNIGTDFGPVIGSSDEFSFAYYADKFGFEIDDINRLKSMKQDLYFNISKNKLHSFNGCEDIIQSIDGKGVKLAVASSGSLDKIQFSLTEVGFSEYFQVICSADEVKNGKPAPDLFLLASEMLNTEPGKCLVIEDSLKGIEGAKTAGMKVAGFTSSFTKQELSTKDPNIIFDTYEELRRQIF